MPFLSKRRTVARIVVECLEYRFGNGVVDIIPDEIHQFKWSHPESSQLFHRPINGSIISNAFLENAKCFAVEWTCHSVHNESGRILRQHRKLLHSPDDLKGFLSHRLIRLYRMNNFHQRHQRGRVKEMNT